MASNGTHLENQQQTVGSSASSGQKTNVGRQVMSEHGPIIMSPGGTFTRFAPKYDEVNDIVPSMVALTLSGGGGGGGEDGGGSGEGDGSAKNESVIADNAATSSKSESHVFGNSSNSNSNTNSNSSSNNNSNSNSISELKFLRQLYGGAIELQLDERFEDISEVREVPDHQEVFVDKFSETSVIVELLGYSEDIKIDSAGKYFFDDLASCNGAISSSILNQAVFVNGEICKHIPTKFYRCAVIGRQTVAKFNLKETEDIVVCMLLIRLDSVGTDLMITMNIPATSDDMAIFERTPAEFFAPTSSSSSTTIAGAPAESSDAKVHPMLMHFKSIINSLNIIDWALFA